MEWHSASYDSYLTSLPKGVLDLIVDYVICGPTPNWAIGSVCKVLRECRKRVLLSLDMDAEDHLVGRMSAVQQITPQHASLGIQEAPGEFTLGFFVKCALSRCRGVRMFVGTEEKDKCVSFEFEIGEGGMISAAHDMVHYSSDDSRELRNHVTQNPTSHCVKFNLCRALHFTEQFLPIDSSQPLAPCNVVIL
jgi:hypothetical protein